MKISSHNGCAEGGRRKFNTFRFMRGEFFGICLFLKVPPSAIFNLFVFSFISIVKIKVKMLVTGT